MEGSPTASLQWSMLMTGSLTMLLLQNGNVARLQKFCGSLAPGTEVLIEIELFIIAILFNEWHIVSYLIHP